MTFFITPGDANHIATFDSGYLSDDATDGASSTSDSHRFSGFWFANFQKAEIRRIPIEMNWIWIQSIDKRKFVRISN